MRNSVNYYKDFNRRIINFSQGESRERVRAWLGLAQVQRAATSASILTLVRQDHLNPWGSASVKSPHNHHL